jgi:O-glycosyl hydrolase
VEGRGGGCRPAPAGLVSRRSMLRAAAAATLASSLPAQPRQAFASTSVTAGSSTIARINPSPSQTMEGFGASGAWWPNDLAHFRADVQDQLAELLFSPRSGIGLSAFRYNLGAGGTGVSIPNHATETFLSGPGQYDWSRDRGGRTFLTHASQYRVPLLVGFANSAPAAWTSNHLCQGGTLQPGTEVAFAAYLADVAAHFEDSGVGLTHLSPMNEPAYDFAGAGQEGMTVPVEQRGRLVQAVIQELSTRSLNARVIADESSQVAQLLSEAPKWLANDGNHEQMAAVAHHLYDFPSDDTLKEARQLGERFRLPLWATEISCQDSRSGGFGQQFDPTMTSAMNLANLVWQALTQANAAAFHWWVAASSAIGADPTDPDVMHRSNDAGWNDGLVYYDPNFTQNQNQQLYLSKRFWAMGNFSRYVRPGAQRHDVSGVDDPLRVLIFSTNHSWTVVAINNASAGAAPQVLSLQFPSPELTLLAPIEAWETSATRDLAPIYSPRPPAAGLFRASLPPQSITTFILPVLGVAR